MKPISNKIISLINNKPWLLRYDKTLHAFVPEKPHPLLNNKDYILLKGWETYAGVCWAKQENIPFFNPEHIEIKETK